MTACTAAASNGAAAHKVLCHLCKADDWAKGADDDAVLDRLCGLARDLERAKPAQARIPAAAEQDAAGPALEALIQLRNHQPLPAEPPTVLSCVDDVKAPLLACHRSLVETGAPRIAEGRLTDLLRQVAVFGLTIVRLDIRQDSQVHTHTLDVITKELAIGSYASWSEARRMTFLSRELEGRRPLLGRRAPDDAVAHETLQTMAVCADQAPGALGAYIISMATAPSDVLAVALLQREAGLSPPLRIVPLFETLADLDGAAETMDTLFSTPAYREMMGDAEIPLQKGPCRAEGEGVEGDPCEDSLMSVDTVVYLAVDERVLARFHFSDPIRSEAPAAIRELEKLGVSSALLTGDSAAAAAAVSEATGVAVAGFGLNTGEMRTFVHMRTKEAPGGVALVSDSWQTDLQMDSCPSIRFGTGMRLGDTDDDVTIFTPSLKALVGAVRRAKALRLKRRRLGMMNTAYCVSGWAVAATGLLPLWLAATIALIYGGFTCGYSYAARGEG